MSPEEFERFKTIRLTDTSRKTLVDLEIDLQGLAPFMLKPELYEKCGKTWNRQRLAVELGSCWVLATLDVEPESVFRSAMVLPLVWRKNRSESPLLPEGLLELARKVKQNLGGDAENWSLHPGVRGMPSIRNLMPYEKAQSAWFALYAGLKLAMEGILPDPHVFATGRWENGVHPVAGVPAKIQAARDCDAMIVFVPEACKTEDLSADLVRYIKSAPEIETALAPYLGALAGEPLVSPDSSSEEKLEIYDRFYARKTLANLDEHARRFYMGKIAPELIKIIQKDLALQEPIAKYQGGILISWVSNAIELILNDAIIFKPEKILLLTSGSDFLDQTKKLRKMLSDPQNNCDIPVIPPLPADQTVEETQCWLREILEQNGASSGKRIFEITPGTALMSVLLCEFADPETLRIYWNKKMLKRLIEPRSSKLIAWNSGNSPKKP